MSERTLQARLENIITGLERLTPDQIAAKFKEAGIKGVPEEPAACPLAVYLARTLNLTGDQWAYADLAEVIIFRAPEAVADDHNWPDTGNILASLTLPATLHTFICKFDEGQYPQLRA